ncbi:MAG: hypothetical protein BHW44_00595 [Roseburia sp. 40_7]|nr:MAG: hypothetical protein BHW44_00595 [Roseburia sp. 40_7]
MNTQIYKIDSKAVDHRKMEEAAQLIRSGELVAFPTETVYGLGADALNPQASKKIYAAKGRPSDNPLIVHIAKFEDLEEIAKYISLNRFIKYSKMHRRKIKTYIYKDYLRFAKLLGFDLKNNEYAFPKNLQEEHDKLSKQYKLQCDQIIKNAIIKRGKELSSNKYKKRIWVEEYR